MKAGDALAVYGLLRIGGGALERLGVRDMVAFEAAGTAPGRLYDLGAYPGVVAPGAGERVRVDLLRVLDAAVTPILDAFEDYAPDDLAGSRYLRVTTTVALAGAAAAQAGERTAWIYQWNGPTPPSGLIASGDWLAHLATR